MFRDAIDPLGSNGRVDQSIENVIELGNNDLGVVAGTDRIFEIVRFAEPVFHYVEQELLVVGVWLVALDVRAIEFQENGADVAVLPFDGRLASSVEQPHQVPAVFGLVGALAA